MFKPQHHQCSQRTSPQSFLRMFACAKPIMVLTTFLLILPTLLLALGGGHAAAASVTQVNQVAKLISSDAVAYDFFGVAVAIDGDTLLVGANGDDDHGSASGAAYVFVRSNGVWVQQAKLTPNDGAVDDEFGRYVALAGNTALIGSHWHDARGANSGAAYVFVRNGTSWTQQAKLTASDAAVGDEFGWGLAIEGDLALVGAPYNDALGTDSGALYAFVRSGTTWTQQAKLTASDGDADDRFGWFLALNSGTAVVGALADEAKGFASGSAYVFTYNGSSWSQQAKLTASDGAGNDQFGAAVAVHRDTAIISAIENDAFGTNSGAAYVFVRNGTSWTQQAKLNATDAAAGDKFGGWGVAIQYDVAVVGSAFSDSSAVDTGALYVFARNGTNWSQQSKVVASDSGMGDLFGWSVALSGNRVVTGGHANDDSGVDSGSAYVFDTTMLAAISGTVSDSNGTGVAGVTISTSGGSTTTGSNGAYTLSGLATGSYTLTPAKTSCTFTPASRVVTVPPDGSNQTFSATCTAPTYAIAGTVSDSNGTGVAGVTISTSGGSTTTGSNGAYTLPNVPTGSVTLTPTKSGYTFTPTTRQIMVSGNVSGQDFTATVPSGRVFKVDRDGLSFRNFRYYGADWTQFKQTFPATPMELSNGVRRKGPESYFNSVYYQGIGNGGNCAGFAAVSLIRFLALPETVELDLLTSANRAISPPFLWQDFLSSPYGVRQITAKQSDLADYVHLYQARQLTEQAITWDSSHYTDTPLQTYQAIQASVALGTPLAVSIRQGNQGHRMTAYRTTESGGWGYIYVYDNNWPNDANRQIALNLATGQWSYALDAQTTWGGTGDLTYTPANLNFPGQLWARYDTDGVLATAAVNAGTLLAVDGDASLLITDDQGRQMGYKHGSLVMAIPNAAPIYNLGYNPEQPTADNIVGFYLPPTVPFSVTLQPIAGTGTYTLTAFGNGSALRLDDISIRAGTVDTLVLNGAVQQTTFIPATDDSYCHILTREFATASRDFTACVTANTGTAVQFGLDSTGNALTVGTQSGSAVSLTATMHQVGTEARTTTVSQPIAPGTSVTVNVGARKTVYLPLLLR